MTISTSNTHRVIRHCPTAPADTVCTYEYANLPEVKEPCKLLAGQRSAMTKDAISLSTSGSLAMSVKGDIKLSSRPLSDDDTISRYLSLAGGHQWANCREELLTLLLDSGHTVDIDDSTDDLCHVVVGKNGLTLSGKGDSIGVAMCEALLAYIRFTGAVKRDQDAGVVNLARSAMPFYTAISWMLLGCKVRRVIWDADMSLSLQPGVTPAAQELIHGRLLGVPVEYYSVSTQDVVHQEPKLLLHLTNNLAHVWRADHTSLLATDWELVE